MKRLLLIFSVACLTFGFSQSLKHEVIKNYADIVLASYQDSLELAQELKISIDSFLAEPNEKTHQLAKEAWLAAQEPYGQTEAYRFYGGPIDDENGPEGLLNAWPLDEAYIDYVEGAPETGIISNTVDYPEINKALLISLNEVGAEENISTGYHAIEFLLWGQDLSRDTNGQRSYTDYTTADHAERRSDYLAAAAELLVENLSFLVESWDDQTAGNYRESFLAAEPDASITNMLTGMGVLAKSELAGERIFTAYHNQDQEDEHSCFSDNTHRDIITNAQGIRNVYMGQYTRTDGSKVEGTSLADVLEAVDADLNQQMVGLLDSSLKAANAIHTPFDQAIVLADHRPGVLDTVNALQDLGDKIAEAATALGISVNTALPQ